MKLALYCTCGASGTGSISPAKNAEAFVAAWNQAHAGEGHQPCDQKTAAAARRRQDRQAEKEERQRDRE